MERPKCWSLIVACVCLAVVNTGGGATATLTSRPNVVFILADDVGRELLSCYGGRSHQTPRIDRLAADGMRFTHAYVMPVCHPTRTTLLTGQYPYRLGHPEWGTFPRRVECRTLPNLVKQAGYQTVVAGKWQLTLLKDDLDQPYRLGFDEYCLYGWHEGPWYYQPHIWQNGRRRGDIRDRFGPDVVGEFLIDFLRRHRQQPFFAFYPMSLCHSETNDLDQPAPLGPHGRYDTLAEMVAKMDQAVGRVVDALDELGLREKTLILFASDNGTDKATITSYRDGRYIDEPNVTRFVDRTVSGGKGQLTDWGTRVPLIATWPGVIAAGQVSDILIDASDFLPTIVALTGAKLPSGETLDGRSIAPLLQGKPAAGREVVFAEHKGRAFVKDRRWKLYSDGEFYDTENDPDERHNLASEKLSAPAAAACVKLGKLWPGGFEP